MTAPKVSRAQVRDLFLAELARRGVAASPEEDGSYSVRTEDGWTVSVSLENVARDLARDLRSHRMTTFVDAVLAPRRPPAWSECAPRAFWCVESAAHELGTTLAARVSEKVARVVVVTDARESTLTWITTEQLEKWGVAREAVEQTAFDNLDALLARSRPPEVKEVHGSRLGMLPIESVFKASTVFAPRFRDYVEPAIGWPVLVTIPDRGFIYVFAERDQALLRSIGAVVQTEYRAASYPVTTEVLRIADDGIEAIGAFPE